MARMKKVSNTEVVADIISGTAQHFLSAEVKTISYRIPVWTLTSVDAMASKAGKSRNAMLNLLLKVGVEEVRKHLSQEVAEDLMGREATASQHLLNELSESLSE